MHSILASAALSALTLSTLSLAEVQRQCPQSGVCFAFGVPESSISSGTGNIYFQISAPTSYSWVALGTGSQMLGSNMFVMYTDGKGNVTMSPRQGTDHRQPQEDTSSTAAKLTVLAGSGVDGDTMTANVMCSNCDKWANGGEMKLSSTSSSWIAAWKSGDALATTNKNQAISRHDDNGYTIFSLDLTTASVSRDANPFQSSSNDGSSSGSGSGSGSGSSSGDGASSGSGFGFSGGGGIPRDTSRLVAAHGVIMSIVFVLLYPFGSLLMPVVGKWMVHSGWQMLTFMLMWAGFGLGIVVGQRRGYNFNKTHTKMGLAVCILMILQPVLGYLHHMHYVKHQSRGGVSYAHMAYGRILMILGVVTGGLGLDLAGADHDLIVAYAVVSAIVFVIYFVTKGCTSMRKRFRARANSGDVEGFGPHAFGPHRFGPRAFGPPGFGGRRGGPPLGGPFGGPRHRGHSKIPESGRKEDNLRQHENDGGFEMPRRTYSGRGGAR